jgi:hypothetical protein
MSQSLDVLHRGIVAPQLAALVEFDRRMAELTEKMKTLKTEAAVVAWHREALSLVRDLETKVGTVEGTNDLRAALERGMLAGGWHFAAVDHYWLVPGAYSTNIRVVTTKLQERIQDLILKDMISARDESTPPEYKELVERYYEVLSKSGGGK